MSSNCQGVTSFSGRTGRTSKSKGLPSAKTLPSDKPESLSHEDQELLKRLLITISKGERSIERQRQVLASLSRFEPHSAFQRIDRDQDSRVSSLELLKFLRDNGVEEATEADTHYIVKYFDSNEDELLDYEDLMQMVMPCDDQYLRAAIAQRDIYEVTKYDLLDAEIEAELTRLFEKEIALNRVTEELKQEMDATKSFCVKKAFYAIDDWKYGYIDKKNLKSFLRKHNYLASTSECMAIIRRLDLDADARLSKREFVSGLRPEEPYSRALKRDQMKRGISSSRQRSGPRHGLSVKSGQLLLMKPAQKTELRTNALDRQHTGTFKGLKVGITPLKNRPQIAPDLSQFTSPRTMGTLKSRKSKRKEQTMQEEDYGVTMEQIPSARSRRSARSLRRTPSVNSSVMKRHASAIASSRRKKTHKPSGQSKKMNKSRSRKSLKRQGSMDDVLIDRLAQPIDHSALRKKIEKEQKRELLKSKPQFLGRSRSRSQKKLSKRDDKKNYKSLVNRLQRGNHDEDSESVWRGTNDFTRLTASQHGDTYDDKSSHKSLHDSRRMRKQRSHRKRSNAADKKENDRTRSQNKDKPTPRDFLKSRDQIREINYGPMIESQLNSIKKAIQSEKQRQPVLSKLSRDRASPQSILPRTEEAFFLRCLQEIILFEKDLEVEKINLSLREDFNLIDAFGVLDEDGKGNINPQELHVALRRLEIPATQEDCYLIFLRLNREVDGLLKYSEFTNAFMPVDHHYARKLGAKRLQYCAPPSRTSFCYETMKHFCQVWHLMVRIEHSVEQIKQKMASRPMFTLDSAFRSCDQTFTGFITSQDFKNLMIEYGLGASSEDMSLLVYRLDKDKDQRVGFLEFKQGLTAQRHLLFQQEEASQKPLRPRTDQELEALVP